MYLLLLSCLYSCACMVSCAPSPTGASYNPHFTVRLRTPEKSSEPSLAISQNPLSIRRSTQRHPRHEALHKSVGHDDIYGRVHGAEKSVTDVYLRGASYVTDVIIGSQSIPLLVDTGSADLWAVPSSFTCLDTDGREVPQPNCGFPITFKGNFSAGVVPDEYFSVYYGSGQFAFGPYGLETVTLGGVTVPNQQISLPTTGFIQSSTRDYAGIIGLGYPGMVAARNGTVPRIALNNTDPFASYDPWFFSAIKQNLTRPVFSLALESDGGGLLGIGGTVDVPITGGYASTPILMIDLVGEARAETQFTFYTIIADDYLINGQSVSDLSSNTNSSLRHGFPVIVDSGFSANMLPPSLVNRYYSAFHTPPQLVDIGGAEVLAAPCDTEVPSFGIKIDNKVFSMSPQDIVIANLNTTVNGTLVCGLGIQPGLEEAGALGDPFLSGVVAVFDIGASEMRFASRVRATKDPAFGPEGYPGGKSIGSPTHSLTAQPGGSRPKKHGS